MAAQARTKFEQEVVDAFIESRAVDFEKLGSLLSRYGARAAQAGIPFGVVVGRHVLYGCIPPDPVLVGAIRAASAELAVGAIAAERGLSDVTRSR